MISIDVQVQQALVQAAQQYQQLQKQQQSVISSHRTNFSDAQHQLHLQQQQQQLVPLSRSSLFLGFPSRDVNKFCQSSFLFEGRVITTMTTIIDMRV
jgi:hypothetical protein